MKVFGKIPVIISVFLLATECHAFTCGVTTTPVKFNNYDVFSASPTNSTGTITVNCNNPGTRPIPVTVAISSGGSGTFNPRQMKSATGTERLNYFLFTDPGQTVIWGDGTGGTSTVTTMITRQTSLIATVYGTVPPKQNLSAGSFSDSLVVTVSW